MVGNFGVEKIVRNKSKKKAPKHVEHVEDRDHNRRVREAKRTWQ